MAEKGSENADRVSLVKPARASGAPAATVQRPKQVTWVVVALLLTGLLAVAASLSLYGLHSFLVHQLTKANADLKGSDHQTRAQLLKSASQQPTASLIQSAIFLLVLVFVARAVSRGRYWSRWAVIGVWVLATLTRIFGGAFQIEYIVQSAPLVLKLSITLSSLAFIVAVVLVGFVKPIGAWMNLTRPVKPGAAGATSTGRGLFAPREPVRPARQGPSIASPPARAKQRASTETTQRGATAAGARTRAGKSRRTDR